MCIFEIIISRTNGTLEKSGVRGNFKKNIKICKNQIFEKFWDTKQLQKILLFEKKRDIPKHRQDIRSHINAHIHNYINVHICSHINADIF